MTIAIFYTVMFITTWLLHSIFAASGLGGGIILVPTYIALGISIPVAATAGLIMNIISLSVVTGHNYRHKIILWELGILFLIPAVAMAPLGEYVSTSFPKVYAIVIFIAILIYAFYHLIVRRKATHKERIIGKLSVVVAIPVGILAGFLGGFSGIGGGLIILPALTFMEHDYKKIAGTTGFVALFISISALISHIQYIINIQPWLWIVMLSGSLLGGISASYILHFFRSGRISVITGASIIIIILVLVISIIRSGNF